MKIQTKQNLKGGLTVTALAVSMLCLSMSQTHASTSKVITSVFTKAAAKQTVSRSLKPIAANSGFKNIAYKPRTSGDLTRKFNVASYGGWPKNGGFTSISSGKLMPGSTVSRVGDDAGRYVSPKGATISQRALPRGSEKLTVRNYEVVKPIVNWQGRAAPAFGMKGGAMQHKLPHSVRWLKDNGYLRAVKQGGPKPSPSPRLTPNF